MTQDRLARIVALCILFAVVIWLLVPAFYLVPLWWQVEFNEDIESPWVTQLGSFVSEFSKRFESPDPRTTQILSLVGLAVSGGAFALFLRGIQERMILMDVLITLAFLLSVLINLIIFMAYPRSETFLRNVMDGEEVVPAALRLVAHSLEYGLLAVAAALGFKFGRAPEQAGD